MANQRKTVVRGISEVGAVRNSADVSFGRTPPDGVSIEFSGSALEVESGQSTMLEDLIRTSDRVQIRVRLLYADMVNLKEVLGLPDSALTGDLSGATPEVLTAVEGALGSREDQLYIIAPGPVSTRRYEFARTKLRPGVTINQSRDNHVVLEAVWEMLRPTSGDPFTFTDAV